MTDSVLQRMERLESALASLQQTLATTRSELHYTLSIANAANQAHGRIDQLSQRVDQERVVNREVFIQSGCGGFFATATAMEDMRDFRETGILGRR